MDSLCKLCQRLEKPPLSGLQIGKHEGIEDKIGHAKMHHQQMRLGFSGINVTIDGVFASCFPDDSTIKIKKRSVVNKKDFNKKCRYPELNDYCYKLFGKCSGKFSVRCRVCDNPLKVFWKKRVLISRTVINHALVHYGQPLFKCRQCDDRFSSMTAIWQHLKVKHSLSQSQENYVDSVSGHQEEIKKMLDRCFGQLVAEISSVAKIKRKLIIDDSETLQNFCRKLLVNRDLRQRRGTCSLCDTKVQLFQCGAIAYSRIISHANLHIGKVMFNCHRCDHGTVTEGGMKNHVVRKHKLTSSKQHYDNLLSNFQTEIKTQLTLCFGMTTESSAHTSCASEIGKSLEKKPSKPILLRSRFTYCRDLFQDRFRNGLKTALCSECGIDLKCFKKGGQVNSNAVLNHVSVHLEKALFLCRLCDYQFFTKAAVCIHLKTKHPLRSKFDDHFVDLRTDHQEEIKDMLKKCFEYQPESKNVSHKNKPERKVAVVQTKSYLSTFCRGLLVHRKPEDGPLICNICNVRLKVWRKFYVRAPRAISHACLHLDKILFTCHVCNYGTVTTGAMTRHLINVHSLNTSKENYNDISLNYREEIVALLKQCFG